MKMRIFSIMSILALANSFAVASVQTDYDHAADFSQYHTYSWGEVRTKDSLWADRVRQGVDQQLKAKGWTLVSSDADIVILALADSHNQQEEETMYTGGGWRFGGGIATTSTYTTKQGVLVISMFDAKSKKVAWRSTATGGLSDNPDKNIGKLNSAVGKMFKKFPPGKP